MVRRSVISGIVGAVLTFIGIAAAAALASILAFTNEEQYTVPQILTVWSEEVDGVRGLVFDPDFAAALVTVVVVAALFAAVGAMLGRPASGADER